ncbi:MAG: hypothetical protein M1381_08360 [Deltaproteobacteria bacterium]|nr:hypothetical protein [Deltaproteobacteria bacterium]
MRKDNEVRVYPRGGIKGFLMTSDCIRVVLIIENVKQSSLGAELLAVSITVSSEGSSSIPFPLERWADTYIRICSFSLLKSPVKKVWFVFWDEQTW